MIILVTGGSGLVGNAIRTFFIFFYKNHKHHINNHIKNDIKHINHIKHYKNHMNHIKKYINHV